MKNLETYMSEQLRKPEVLKEYNALEEEYAAIKNEIEKNMEERRMEVTKVSNERYEYKIGYEDVVAITYFAAEQHVYDGRIISEPANAKVDFDDGSYIILYNLLRVVFK